LIPKREKKGKMTLKNSKVKFKYDKLRINTDDAKKWYVSYTIKFTHPFSYNPIKTKPKSTHYIKCYGGEYSIRLNDTALKDRPQLAEKLLKRVKKDLDLQLDPKYNLDRVGLELMSKAELVNGVPYQDAINRMIKYYGWENPAPSSKITAHNSKIFFNAAFRKYVASIEKLEDVTQITSDDIESYLIKMNTLGKWNIVTCLSRISTITQLFIPLLDAKLIDRNPTSGLLRIKKKLKRTPQKPKKKRFEVWTDQELEEFHKVANTDEHRFYYTLGMVCYHCYLRRSEMFNLTLSHLELDRKRFAVNSDLTKSARKYDSDEIIYIPIPKDLVPILETYLDQRFGNDRNPDYFLFPDGDDLTKAHNYFEYNNNYIKDLGVKLSHKKLNYALKHTGVSQFWRFHAEKGTQVNLVLARLQKMCRHSTPIETMTYLSTELGIEMDSDIFD
jgi:integrase